MKRSVALYAFTLLIFGAGIFLAIEQGKSLRRSPPGASAREESLPAEPNLQPGSGHGARGAVVPSAPSVWTSIKGNLEQPLSRLFLQLILILSVAHLVGSLFVRIGQPAVVGEMFAGLLLGPSVLGGLSPGLFNLIFASSSMGTLRLLSQVGVCLFMFVVGMELDLNHLRGRASSAILVSHVSILFPYFLGVALSLFLFAEFAGPKASFLAFALFMGISMSITAFPVLARILQERHLETTALGTTALTCAAIGDVTAWTILAFVVAIVRSNGLNSALLSIVLVVVFTVMMRGVVRPGFARWVTRREQAGASEQLTENAGLGKGVLAVVLILTFISALTTELMGIHALFGAFLAGVIMPDSAGFRKDLRLRLENFSSIFLLPLFFAFTGLRTQIGLLNDAQSWLVCGLIILIATLGKLGGSMLTARFTGLNWIDSFSLGALMNTRGLMELIAINIGYELGILSPQMFAMLVIMALATTFMTGPLLSLGELLKEKRALAPAC
jgi:Kef-type K+ transport system membrane component KefB